MSLTTMPSRTATFLQICRNPRMWIMLLLGFSSSMPVALAGATMQAWLTVYGIKITTIGYFGLVGLPFTIKFLWAPLMDRFVPPGLGRRRGWMVTTQIALVIAIIALSQLDPQHHLVGMAVVAFLITFLAASQDIAIDAYRTDVLPAEELGLGTAMYVSGYRIAGLVSGGLALILADKFGWSITYICMAAFMGFGLLAALVGEEPNTVAAPKSIRAAVLEPFREFAARPGAIALLMVIVLYKLGDAFALQLTTTFLIRGVGFSLTDVGMVKKILEIVGSFAGLFVGGWLMLRWSIFKSLVFFGCLQALSNLLFMLLALVGHNYPLMAFTLFTEFFCSGMGTAGFMAFLMMLCDHRYTATQYALFSALAMIPRTFLGPVAGYMVASLGWAVFFFWTFIIALPGLFVLWHLRGKISEMRLLVTEGNG